MKLSKPYIHFPAIVLLTLVSIAKAGEPISLRVGPVKMVFDADNVFLRYIRVGPHEVLRGINAPIHADVVNSTRQFVGDHALVIGPITLAPQFVDGEDAPGGPPTGGALPTYVDTRQVEPFTAAGTLGSLKYLAEAGAHSATFFETIGWNGIMDADDVASRPKAFPSLPGEPFPVYHLLREIGEFAGGAVRQINSSKNLAAVGLALRQPGRMRVLVGNLTGKAHTVTLRGLSGKPVAIQTLVAKKTQATPGIAISLPPYRIARIDQVVD